MASKGSILDDLYTDSGGFDEERAGDVLKKLITIQRGTHAVGDTSAAAASGFKKMTVGESANF